MTVFALAFVIGVLNGLRSFTPPAAAAWAAHLGWIKLQGPLALMGSVPASESQSEPGVLQQFFDRWVSPRRTATIADLQRGKNAGELRSEAEPELLNDAIFGAIYYRLLLRSDPLTRRFGEELVEQVIRGHRSGNARS